ncbi:hypothetical protein BH23CHL1_BH23CHL1_03850 [soil metagenome]
MACCATLEYLCKCTSVQFGVTVIDPGIAPGYAAGL